MMSARFKSCHTQCGVFPRCKTSTVYRSVRFVVKNSYSYNSANRKLKSNNYRIWVVNCSNSWNSIEVWTNSYLMSIQVHGKNINDSCAVKYVVCESCFDFEKKQTWLLHTGANTSCYYYYQRVATSRGIWQLCRSTIYLSSLLYTYCTSI